MDFLFVVTSEIGFVAPLERTRYPIGLGPLKSYSTSISSDDRLVFWMHDDSLIGFSFDATVSSRGRCTPSCVSLLCRSDRFARHDQWLAWAVSRLLLSVKYSVFPILSCCGDGTIIHKLFASNNTAAIYFFEIHHVNMVNTAR